MLLRRTRQSSRDEIAALRAENERLLQMVKANQNPAASFASTKTGYLFKYRPQATSLLWANTWENRYFLIQGHTLSYYRSEQDIHFPPRGKIELLGTFIYQEGLKLRKYHTFNIQDSNGVVLIRLSTESSSDMQSWIEALESAGCTLRYEYENDNDSQSTKDTSNTHGRSPSPSGNSTVSDGRASSPDRGGQEADSQDTPRTAATRHQLLARKNSGYTSDASDVGAGGNRNNIARNHNVQRYASSTGAGRRGGKHSAAADRGCAVVHTQPKYSILSRERISVLNQDGFVTLLCLIVFATNFRLIIENIIKYGLLFNPFSFMKAALTPSGNLLLLLCWPAMTLNCFCALWIEQLGAYLIGLVESGQPKISSISTKHKHRHHHKHHRNNNPPSSPTSTKRAASQRRAAEALIFTLNLVNVLSELLLPCIVIYYTEAEPLPAGALTMVCIVLWMKLISFAHVNADIRLARTLGKYRPGERSSRDIPQGVEHTYDYPENLTVNNLLYFLAAPTLCYQLSYPRSARFRLRWMLRKMVTLGVSLGMMLFIMEQYIEPTIDNSLQPLRDLDWLRMLERVLKLSIPTLYFWLAMFYTLFDLWLNITAEFLRFGDREFYKEWWNATTVGEYWRLWNMPVHKWMLRHVYYPCIGWGIPKFYAGFIVFFISAVFHELLVGVPLHMLKAWAFLGILGQVPLMWMTEEMKKYFKSDRIGNVVFWVSFCFLGQPLAEILYYHDYRKMHQM